MAAAIALFKRYRHVETELAAAKDPAEQRRLIGRAKAIRWPQDDRTGGYRWLQKAMNESRKLAQVVADFVADDENQPGEKP